MTWPLPEEFMVGLLTGLGWGFIGGALAMSWLFSRRRDKDEG